MNLVSIEDIQVKAGESLNEDALAQLGRTLRQVSETPVTKKDFLIMLGRAAQRAISQVDKTKFLAYLCRQPASMDLKKKLEGISKELVESDYSEKRAYQLLTDLQECLSSLIEGSLDAIIPSLVGEAEADRNEFFIPSSKHERNIRQTLDLPENESLEKDDISYVLTQELGKVFRKEAKLVNKELAKIDSGAGEAAGSFGMYLSLSQAAFFGRAGAGLCTATDTGSWNDSKYLQMMMVDEGRGRIVGNIQLHLFKNKAGKASVLARINPTASFVTKVDKDILAREMLRAVQTFAKDNNLVAYMPEQTSWHNLSNRTTFAPNLQNYFGAGENTSVKITRWHSVGRIFRMLLVDEDLAVAA